MTLGASMKERWDTMNAANPGSIPWDTKQAAIKIDEFASQWDKAELEKHNTWLASRFERPITIDQYKSMAPYKWNELRANMPRPAGFAATG